MEFWLLVWATVATLSAVAFWFEWGRDADHWGKRHKELLERFDCVRHERDDERIGRGEAEAKLAKASKLLAEIHKYTGQYK